MFFKNMFLSNMRSLYTLLCVAIVNIYDMVWKPFVLGDCVPCAGSRLKNPLSFYCLTIVSSESLAKGNGYQVFVFTRAISLGIFCK
jgi:hypothetical protein